MKKLVDNIMKEEKEHSKQNKGKKKHINDEKEEDPVSENEEKLIKDENEHCSYYKGKTEETQNDKEKREKRQRQMFDEFISGTLPRQGYVGIRLRGRFKRKAKRSVCRACKQFIDNYDYDCIFYGFKTESRGKSHACRTYYHGTVSCLQKLPWDGREKFLEYVDDCPNLDVRCLKYPLKEI